MAKRWPDAIDKSRPPSEWHSDKMPLWRNESMVAHAFVAAGCAGPDPDPARCHRLRWESFPHGILGLTHASLPTLSHKQPGCVCTPAMVSWCPHRNPHLIVLSHNPNPTDQNFILNSEPRNPDHQNPYCRGRRRQYPTLCSGMALSPKSAPPPSQHFPIIPFTFLETHFPSCKKRTLEADNTPNPESRHPLGVSTPDLPILFWLSSPLYLHKFHSFVSFPLKDPPAMCRTSCGGWLGKRPAPPRESDYRWQISIQRLSRA